jgi:hypothetical protein
LFAFAKFLLLAIIFAFAKIIAFASFIPCFLAVAKIIAFASFFLVF